MIWRGHSHTQLREGTFALLNLKNILSNFDNSINKVTETVDRCEIYDLN